MRAAEALLKLSSMISSSMRFSLTGGQVGWTTKMSRPRTSSSMRTEISPSGKLARVILPRVSPRQWAIFSARGMLARPLKTLSWLLWFMVAPGGFAEGPPRPRKAGHETRIMKGRRRACQERRETRATACRAPGYCRGVRPPVHRLRLWAGLLQPCPGGRFRVDLAEGVDGCSSDEMVRLLR